MAKQYHRPLLTFYLSEAPPRGEPGQDFRTLSETPAIHDEALLQALLRDLSARQGLLRAAFEDDDEPRVIDLVGSMAVEDGQPVVGEAITACLEFSLSKFRIQPDTDAAFKLLRSRAQDAGIFVILIGNLGSYHTDISLDTFRGIALCDQLAPFIAINEHDSHAAWSFTLLHEIAHLGLGQSGVSGGLPERDVERFCNEVASEILLPSTELSECSITDATGYSAVEEQVVELANERNVSNSMIAYRLYRAGMINRRIWEALTDTFQTRWRENKKQQRQASQQQGGGPSYYTIRRQRLGDAMIQMTSQMLTTKALSTSKAARVLGVRPENLNTLIRGSTGSNSPVE